jgi:hypothetical protein
MALVKAAARPLSVSVTPAGGSAVTTADIIEITPIDDTELLEDYSGPSQYPYFWQGKIIKGFRFTTRDLLVYSALTKGGYVDTATAQIEGVRTGDGTKQGSADVIEVVVTDGVIRTLEQPKSDTAGNPLPFTVEIIAAHGEDGTEGTCTSTVTTA